jgi:hypothetical protein
MKSPGEENENGSRMLRDGKLPLVRAGKEGFTPCGCDNVVKTSTSASIPVST